MAYYFKIEKELINNALDKAIQILQDKIIENAEGKIAASKVNIAYKSDETVAEAKEYLMTRADAETDKFYLFTRATFESWFVDINELKEASDYYIREKTGIYKKIKKGHKVKSNTQSNQISTITDVYRGNNGTYVDVTSSNGKNIWTGEPQVYTHKIEGFAEKIYRKQINIIV
jgi:hypothetical protein